MITPVCTETPKRARKPIPDETLKCVPVSQSASRPPSGARLTLINISSDHLKDLNIVYRMIKISKTVSGMMMASRRFARFWLAYSPAQSR